MVHSHSPEANRLRRARAIERGFLPRWGPAGAAAPSTPLPRSRTRSPLSAPCKPKRVRFRHDAA
eukprot:10752408-Lingulodinium_polyedra.AAC.1